MSFVRVKIPPQSGNWYNYEVETVYIGSKVIQCHIQYLGKKGKSHKPLFGNRSHTKTLVSASTPFVQKQPKPKVTYYFCDS